MDVHSISGWLSKNCDENSRMRKFSYSKFLPKVRGFPAQFLDNQPEIECIFIPNTVLDTRSLGIEPTLREARGICAIFSNITAFACSTPFVLSMSACLGTSSTTPRRSFRCAGLAKTLSPTGFKCHQTMAAKLQVFRRHPRLQVLRCNPPTDSS